MRIDSTTKTNKIAIFVLLTASIVYHVVVGLSTTNASDSLFHSGVSFSTHALRNTFEPLSTNPLSPLMK